MPFPVGRTRPLLQWTSVSRVRLWIAMPSTGCGGPLTENYATISRVLMHCPASRIQQGLKAERPGGLGNMDCLRTSGRYLAACRPGTERLMPVFLSRPSVDALSDT